MRTEERSNPSSVYARDFANAVSDEGLSVTLNCLISDRKRFLYNGDKTPQNYKTVAEGSFWKPEVVADEWKPKLEPEEWRPEQNEVEDESSDSEVEEILSISPELKIRDVDDDDSFQFRSVSFSFLCYSTFFHRWRN